MAATVRQKDIWLFVTAHPDDESMFFFPTLRYLATNSDGARHVLCLSTGDYGSSDGIVRTKELHAACDILGCSCEVLDDEQFKDGPNEVWDSEIISKKVLDCVKQLVIDTSVNNCKKETWQFVDNRNLSTTIEQQTPININIVTFDSRGVSSHPNHIDTFKGVRYLLDEKAIHIQNDKNTIHSYMYLRNGECDIKLKVHVWILRTISNPIYKYVFWASWELLPHIMLLLLRLFWQLILFLLGSGIWSRKTKMQLVSALTAAKEITHITSQYRVMEPILAWRAMAAHRSQFVWYRRLSILFSRYTFINNLTKLFPDESYLTNEEETTLPPISIIEEKESSYLLDCTQMNIIREKILPPSLQLRPWNRIYSLSRDGDSFISFQKLVGDWNSRIGQHCTLLVVKTAFDEIIGGYANVPFVETTEYPIGGTADSCLFKMKDLDVVVYGKGNSGDKRIVLDATRRMVGFGGGAGIDRGRNDGFGLCLNDGFLRGTTARCEAFGNEPLVNDSHVFEVTDVEVWGFVFGQL